MLLLALALAPPWIYPHFPSQDGPNHLYSAGVLRHYGAGGPEGELYRRFYTISARPNPNWLSQGALAGLLALAPPAVAEKILLNVCILLLGLGMRHALRAVRPGAGALAVLVLPFSYNWPLHMGFYNFCLSLGVMGFTLGVWMRHERHPRPRHAAALAGLLLALYFSHLVTLAMTVLALAVLTGWLTFFDRRAGAGTPGEHPGRARLLFTLAGVLPALALAAAFLGHGATTGDVPAPFALYYHPRKWLYLLTLETTLFTFRVNEMLLAAVLTGGLFAVTLAALGRRLRRWKLRRGDGWILVGLVWLAAYLLAPPNSGKGTYLYHRLAIFPFFALILWLGAAELPRLARLAAQSLGAGLALILMLFYSQRYGEAQAGLTEYLSASSAIPRGAVILPVCLDPRGRLPDGRPYAVRSQPYVHASGWVALARGAVDLSDYEGQTDHFPTRLRPALDPGRHLAQAPLDPAAYERATGVRIDAVLLWGAEGRPLKEAVGEAMAGWLEAHFQWVYISPPGGRMAVYRRPES